MQFLITSLKEFFLFLWYLDSLHILVYDYNKIDDYILSTYFCGKTKIGYAFCAGYTFVLNKQTKLEIVYKPLNFLKKFPATLFENALGVLGTK